MKWSVKQERKITSATERPSPEGGNSNQLRENHDMKQVLESQERGDEGGCYVCFSEIEATKLS